MNPVRRTLTEILRGGTVETLANAWREAETAKELNVLAPGEYSARIISGELVNSKSNSTPGYRLTFSVLDGEHAGRRFWHDIWLTPAALPMAKRDLAKVGVTSLEQLESPFPQGIRCRAKLVSRRSDQGDEYNLVKSFEVIGIDTVDADQFAPQQGEVRP